MVYYDVSINLRRRVQNKLETRNQWEGFTGDKLQTLYLPVEIKLREYEAQAYLAVQAASLGFRVFLGSHAAIYALLRKATSPQGLYLDKSIPEKNRISWLKQRCRFIWVMDAELSPAHSFEALRRELPSRIQVDSFESIDKFLVVNNSVRRAICDFAKSTDDKVMVTGWPRLDLLSEHLRSYFQDDIKRIQKTYPQFLLFASSFGNNRDPRKTMGQRTASLYAVTPFYQQNTNLKRYENFLKCVSILKAWDKDSQIPPIVVRPHPAESIKLWKYHLRGSRKTYVVREGSAIPWLHASQGLVHQGSTLAIEAGIMGLRTFLLKDCLLDGYSEFTETISRFIASLVLPPTDDCIESKENTNPNYSISSLENIVHIPKDGASHEILSQITQLGLLGDLHVNSLNLFISQFSPKSVRRALGLIRDEILWAFNKINIHPQLQSIPNGLGAKEISQMVRIFGNNQVRFVRKTINLWEITPRG